MDRAWVEAALAAIESVRIEADGEERFPLPSGALLGLPEPHAQPFAAMLDHPAVTKRLQVRFLAWPCMIWTHCSSAVGLLLTQPVCVACIVLD